MLFVDPCNVSHHSAAVSEIGVVLAPSEVMTGVLKVRVWKSVPSVTVPSEVEVMGYAPSEDVLQSELLEFVWETVAMVEL